MLFLFHYCVLFGDSVCGYNLLLNCMGICIFSMLIGKLVIETRK